MKLSDFESAWRIDRQIDDRRQGRTGTFAGEARFRPDAEGLVYDESGVLCFPGEAPLAAERRYLWRDVSGGFAVCFADGRLFHEIRTATPRPAARHACDPDTYDVRYDFSAFPRWSARWRVTGPRKDYIVQSTYDRLSS